MRHPSVILFGALFFMFFLAGCIDTGEQSYEPDATCTLYGTITSAENVPLEGVYVSVTGQGLSYSDWTDKNGEYLITDIPNGDYYLRAVRSGYENVVSSSAGAFIEGRTYSTNITMKAESQPDLPDGGAVGANITDVPINHTTGNTGRVYGHVTYLGTSDYVEGATVYLTSNSTLYTATTDKDGDYSIGGLANGPFSFVIVKEGYVNFTSPSSGLRINEGEEYSWSAELKKAGGDAIPYSGCLYYSVNTSVNYVLRYGCELTTYRGYVECTMAYPGEATYSLSPQADGSLSSISTYYQGQNRVLKWKVDNSDNLYSYVQGHGYMDMKGTQSMRLVTRQEIPISSAASSQPNYLGSETLTDLNTNAEKTMIDPTDSRIRAVAQQVKSEMGSEDTWTVARAMFIWLKQNTAYHTSSQSDTYTQSATEMMSSKAGDCDELSYLYISLLRAAGIPARYVRGFMVDKDPSRYIGHAWVEFYAGEWVPVEVASDGTYNQTRANWNADINLGVHQPDHVAVFVDDGSGRIFGSAGASWYSIYYEDKPSVSSYIHYDAVEYDPMYIKACDDGTKELVKDKG